MQTADQIITINMTRNTLAVNGNENQRDFPPSQISTLNFSAPMNSTDDQHLGQKNEELMMLKSGTSFVTRVKAINITNLPRELNLNVQMLCSQTGFPPNVAPSNTNLSLGLKFVEGTSNFISSNALFAKRLTLRSLEKIKDELIAQMERSQVSHSAMFEPWESCVLEISGQVPHDAEVGQRFRFRVIQRIGKIVTSGYTIQIVVV